MPFGVYFFFPLLELQFSCFKLLQPFVISTTLFFMKKKLETFMNSLIKVPPSECRLKVPTPESTKPMNIYIEKQQMNAL